MQPQQTTFFVFPRVPVQQWNEEEEEEHENKEEKLEEEEEEEGEEHENKEEKIINIKNQETTVNTTFLVWTNIVQGPVVNVQTVQTVQTRTSILDPTRQAARPLSDHVVSRHLPISRSIVLPPLLPV